MITSAKNTNTIQIIF